MKNLSKIEFNLSNLLRAHVSVFTYRDFYFVNIIDGIQNKITKPMVESLLFLFGIENALISIK